MLKSKIKSYILSYFNYSGLLFTHSSLLINKAMMVEEFFLIIQFWRIDNFRLTILLGSSSKAYSLGLQKSRKTSWLVEQCARF